MRVFRKLTPAKDWDQVHVSKTDKGYELDIYNGPKYVSKWRTLRTPGDVARELEAMGCNIALLRQHLPAIHMDIGDSTVKGV